MISLTTNNIQFELDDLDKDLVILARWKKSNDKHITESTNYFGRQYLHIIIAKRMGLDTINYQIDHKDGNKLNNKRTNLRQANQIQNSQNSRKRKNSTSQYKGVSWATREQKWEARIEINKVSKFLGYYHDEKEAAKAYNRAALHYFKEFAYINEVA